MDAETAKAFALIFEALNLQTLQDIVEDVLDSADAFASEDKPKIERFISVLEDQIKRG